MLGENIFITKKNSYSLVYRLRYFITQMVSLQFLGSADLLDLNMMNLFFTSLNFSSQLKSYIGIINFRGAEGTRFGRLEDFSRLFFELKYSF